MATAGRRAVFTLVLTFVSSGADSGQFLWLSDLHYDAYYNATLAPKCICNNRRFRTVSALDVSDAQCLVNAEMISNYGQPNCDAPFALAESTLQAAAAAVPDPDFVIITGDYTRHDTKEFGADSSHVVTHAIQTMMSLTEKYFKSARVFHLPQERFGFIFGNNDFETNYGHPSPSFNANVTKAFSNDGAWNVSNIEAGGFSSYVIPLDAGVELTVISLNTVLYAPGGKNSESDPFGQLAWLEEQLATLSAVPDASSKRVYICAHIPPAFDAYSLQLQWEPKFIKAYFAIVERYSSLIKAQLFGHTHKVGQEHFTSCSLLHQFLISFCSANAAPISFAPSPISFAPISLGRVSSSQQPRGLATSNYGRGVGSLCQQPFLQNS